MAMFAVPVDLARFRVSFVLRMILGSQSTCAIETDLGHEAPSQGIFERASGTLQGTEEQLYHPSRVFLHIPLVSICSVHLAAEHPVFAFIRELTKGQASCFPPY